MRAVLQRSGPAWVLVDGKETGRIKSGLVIFLGVAQDDNEEVAVSLADKCCELRIFQDNEGKMNLSLGEVKGEVLVISQFTLFAELRRPFFGNAGDPKRSEELYNVFINRIRQRGIKVSTGIFGAMMNVHLENQGPVTILLERKKNRQGFTF